MTRADRLHHDRRIKAKTLRKAKAWKVKQATPKWIGRTAAVHWTCSCWTCTHDRKPAFEKMYPTELYA